MKDKTSEKDDKVLITFRIDKPLLNIFDSVVQKEGCSRQEIMDKIVYEYLKPYIIDSLKIKKDA